MTFDPKTFTNLSPRTKASLTRELGAQTKADAHHHIADLAKRADAGDDNALCRLGMSAAASLAVIILGDVGKVVSDGDPRGDEVRLMLGALPPDIAVVVILSALRSAGLAYLDLKVDLADFPTVIDISDMIWEDVRDMALEARKGQPVGRHKSKHGADIFVVPARKKD